MVWLDRFTRCLGHSCPFQGGDRRLSFPPMASSIVMTNGDNWFRKVRYFSRDTRCLSWVKRPSVPMIWIPSYSRMSGLIPDTRLLLSPVHVSHQHSFASVPNFSHFLNCKHPLWIQQPWKMQFSIKSCSEALWLGPASTGFSGQQSSISSNASCQNGIKKTRRAAADLRFCFQSS